MRLPGNPEVLGKHHTTEDAGQKLRRIRERLDLRVRDVEQASFRIAEKHGNEEFAVLINRISEIENRGLVPNIYKLYSLCAIYRLDMQEVLEWFGVSVESLAEDSQLWPLARTHLLSFQADPETSVLLPLALDPGIDIRKTTYLSRMIQRWGRLPLVFLEKLDLKDHRYAFIGTDDWFLYPLLMPGSLVMIDETKRKLTNSRWANDFERPIYFFEHREGYACAWYNVAEGGLILQPHPNSGCKPQIFAYPSEIEVIGQVTGVAMRIDEGRRRRTRSASDE